jgi:citrate lyase subunit alpha/citrate CoA-transferase
MKFNGKDYAAFKAARTEKYFSSSIVSRKIQTSIPPGMSKITTIDQVMDLIADGDTISYPHYYRLGDHGLKLIVEKLIEHKKRNIKISTNAVFDHTDPWLINACKAGVIGGVYGNAYQKFGKNIIQGDLLPWVGVGISHGNHARKLQTGEIHVKVAFAPVSISDKYGNSNSFMGKMEHRCGPVGLFRSDTEFSDFTVLLAGTIAETIVMPASFSMEYVDYIVPVETPGLNSGISSGSLDLERIRSNPQNAVTAENIINIIKAAGVVQPNFNFQVGSGTGLIVLDKIRALLKEQKIQAGFAIGGITSMHVEMLKEGTIQHLLNAQMFEPSTEVLDSMLNDKNHHEMSASFYASMANKECAVNLLDMAVLSALEVDINFNVNTVCASGRFIGGIGGAQDVAAGSDLTIIFLPLATGKDGKGFPKVVEKVYTKVTPGDAIDVVATEDYAAVNPNSKSPYRQAIIDNASKFNLKLVSIEELHQKSLEKAKEFGTIPTQPATTDEVVYIIEWRDGTLLDKIYRLDK